MIVPLLRLTLVGPIGDKTRVLARLQEQGCLHLVPLRPAPREPEKRPTARAEPTLQALKYLEGAPRRRRPVTRRRDFDLEEVVTQALANRERLREAEDRRDFLAHRIQALNPWGDFRLPAAADLLGYRLWFYVLPVGRLDRLAEIEIPWQIVHRDTRQAYLVLIAREEPRADLLPVPRVHTGAVSLGDLQAELEETEILLESLAAEREALTRWVHLLRRNLDRAEDEAALTFARQQTQDGADLFAVQGWIPREALAGVAALRAEEGLAMQVAPPGPADRPPTLYRNPEPLAGGEDLVDFYQTPGYHGWDPSTLVFFSFALFFAMILADAGYALVLGLMLAWWWRALGRSARGVRMRTLGAVIAALSVLYGVLAGSFFGFGPPAEGPFARLAVLDLHAFDAMMRLSILVGAAHVVLANLLAAWNRRREAAALPHLGWVLVTLGGVGLWLGGPDSALRPLAWASAVLGLSSVLLFSAPGPWRPAKALAGRLLAGLVSLSRLTQLFGDVLSYMRLFALGLAGTSLAVSFNQLADQVQAAVPGLGFFLSLLVLALGHGLNLLLSVVSGVVHGLRLNFIEFFNWGMSEEGYPFKPFSKKEKTLG